MEKKMNENEEQYINFPDRYGRRELNRLYREIPLKDTTSRLLRKYFNAMANFYGILPLRKAKDIIFSLDPKLVTEEEFWAFAGVARHESEDYVILGEEEVYADGEKSTPSNRKIVSLPVVYNDEFADMDDIQYGKPYYKLTKEELLKYYTPCYFEPTPQSEAMRAYLMRLCKRDEEKVDIILEFMVLIIRSVKSKMDDVFDMLEEFHLSFSSERECNRFLAVYNDFHNTTRMPCNRGFTPAEISKKLYRNETTSTFSAGENMRKMLQSGELTKEKIKENILKADFPTEAMRMSLLKAVDAYDPFPDSKKEKIWRNDPCPCGSGKKYKRCCGK